MTVSGTIDNIQSNMLTSTSNQVNIDITIPAKLIIWRDHTQGSSWV